MPDYICQEKYRYIKIFRNTVTKYEIHPYLIIDVALANSGRSYSGTNIHSAAILDYC